MYVLAGEAAPERALYIGCAAIALHFASIAQCLLFFATRRQHPLRCRRVSPVGAMSAVVDGPNKHLIPICRGHLIGFISIGTYLMWIYGCRTTGTVASGTPAHEVLWAGELAGE